MGARLLLLLLFLKQWLKFVTVMGSLYKNKHKGLKTVIEKFTFKLGSQLSKWQCNADGGW